MKILNKWNKLTSKKKLCILVVFTILCVFIYGLFMVCTGYKNTTVDILNKYYGTKMVMIPSVDGMEYVNALSGWKIMHFLTFFIAGLFFPQYMCEIYTIGVLWEFYECINEYCARGWVDKHVKYNSNTPYKRWGCADKNDLFFNGIGLLLGYGIHKLAEQIKIV